MKFADNSRSLLKTWQRNEITPIFSTFNNWWFYLQNLKLINVHVVFCALYPIKIGQWSSLFFLAIPHIVYQKSL